MQFSISSRIVPILEEFSFKVRKDDAELAGRYDSELSDAFFLLADAEPSRVTVSAKKIELRYEGMDSDYKFEITGKGLSPVRSASGFLKALEDGIAKGELDRIRITTEGVTIFQLDLSDRSMEMKSGADFVRVKGKLPDTFQEITKLATYLENIPLLATTVLTPKQQKAIIKELSAFGVNSISIGSGKTEIMNIRLGEKAVSLTVAGLTIRAEGKFGDDFGDVAARLFQDASHIAGLASLTNPLLFIPGLIDVFDVKSVSFLVKGKPFLKISDFAKDETVLVLDGVKLDKDTRIVLTKFLGNGTEENDLILTSSGNDLAEGADGNDTIYGYAGNDSLVGGAGNDVLRGEAGNDTMDGGQGDDIYYADGGDTIIDTAGGIDTVYTATTHRLADGIEKLVLLGKANADLTGNALDNSITGNAGKNRIDGGAGNDTMSGGAGDDTYVVDSAGDVVTETGPKNGRDTVSSSVAFTLGAHLERLTLTGDADINGTGNTLDNVIRGNAGANLLSGGAGKDTLLGLAGNDTLVGGRGSDQLTGGDGADVFRFLSSADSSVAGTGRDRIMDFTPGEDVIDLSSIDAKIRSAADDAFTFIGRSQFSGVAGQLRFADGALMGDTNGDKRADFRIDISFDDGVTRLVAADLLL